MSEEKKVRNMTEKGFLHYAKIATSASAFLAKHKEWLASGELASITTPILSLQAEKKSILLQNKQETETLATSTLESIKKVVMDHMIAKEVAAAEDAILNPKEAVEKPWQSTIYNERGDIQFHTKEDGSVEELDKLFDSASAADGWSDRRLFDCSPDCYAVVSHTSVTNKFGKALSTTITRDDAILRLMKAAKGPVMKGQSKSAGRLSFGAKVRNDVSVFSKG